MQVWPFKAGSELIESLEWRTDLLRARADEQRIQLRGAPRVSHQLHHLLTHDQYAAARQMMRGAQEFILPDWTESVHVGDVYSGSDVFVPFGTFGTPFTAGNTAVLWESPGRFEVVDIATVSPSGVELEFVTTDMLDARLLPSLPAIAPEGLSVQRPAGKYLLASITMNVTESVDISASSYAQYRGHDVLPVCPVVADGSFEESVIWPADVIDNDLGKPVVIRDRTIPDEKFMMRWHEFGRSGIRALRAWLHSRKGRQKVFWASTWAHDFHLASSIGSADTSILVFNPPGLTTLPRTDFDIEIRPSVGDAILRRVTAVAASTPIDGRSVLQLTITPAAGATLTPGEVRRISYLRCARFDADRFEFLHRAGAGAAVAAPCVEVNVP